VSCVVSYLFGDGVRCVVSCLVS